MTVSLLLLVSLLTAACNPHTPIPDDTIVVALDGFPDQLDPRLARDALSAKMTKLIYSGLLARDQAQDLIPDLAKDFAITDEKTYTFTLNEGVTFHNHKKLTSEDIKATYDSILSGGLVSSFLDDLAVVDSVEAPDPSTVIFKLKQPFAPFLNLLTIGILPAEIARSYLKPLNPAANKGAPAGRYGFAVGTGPWRLVLADDDAGKIVLRRHEDYHGRPAQTENLIFRVIRDGTLRTLEMKKGRLDLVQNGIPYTLVPTVKNENHLELETLPGSNFSYMAFNLSNRYLADLRVRRAIALAIDRDALISYKLEGLGDKATSLMHPTHWAAPNDLRPIAHDPEAARALLDTTPFKDPDGDGPKTRFKLVYKTSSDRERIEIAQVIADYLRRVGIDVEVKPYEFGTLFRDIKQGDFDLFTLTWVALNDPDIYYKIFHSSQIPPIGNNRGHYQNRHLDQLLEKSRVEMDKTKRLALYQTIQKIVYDDMVYVPLWYETNFVFTRKNVLDYELRYDAGYQNLVNVKKAPRLEQDIIAVTPSAVEGSP